MGTDQSLLPNLQKKSVFLVETLESTDKQRVGNFFQIYWSMILYNLVHFQSKADRAAVIWPNLSFNTRGD